jgi:uncharacterized membrane protein YfcA
MGFDLIGLAFAFIVLFAFTVQAVSGFGSTVIALSLGAIWYGLDQLLPFLIFSNILFTSVLAYKNRHHINKDLAFRVVLPGMLLGTVIGYFIKPYLNEIILEQMLGVLIIFISILELWRLLHRNESIPHSKVKSRLLTLFAGLSHGVFASGGPLLVYSIAGFKVDKHQFRATVLVCLFVLNCLLAFAFLIDGRLQPVLPFVLAAIPIIFIAMKVGNILHDYVNEEHFKKGVFIFLLLSGINLLVARHLT